MKPNSDPIFDFGVIDNNGYIIADEDGETDFIGLFCAGDIRQKRMRQSITAAADGANAVQSVIDYLKNFLNIV
jgi:thioredoxin reductase (NADPH)